MRNIMFIILLFLLSACSFKNPFSSEEIGKVTVVNYAPYFKHHRAYFNRTHLKKLSRKKYQFLYHAKKRTLSVLLHHKNRYLLYNFTKPNDPTFSLLTKLNHKQVLKILRKKGYRPKNLHSLGFTAKVSLRLYEGVKTLMIEVKDYRRLQRLYINAIKYYDIKKIKSIKTLLPKSLIYTHYMQYQKRAKEKKEKDALRFIAHKLGFDDHLPKKQKKITPSPRVNTVKKQVVPTKKIEAKDIVRPKTTPEQIVSTKPQRTTKSYMYYLHSASYNELRRYLIKKETSASLSYEKYKKLQKHAAVLKEEKLFNEGSLEELIEAYKINSDPRYKKRIMLLIKAKQKD